MGVVYASPSSLGFAVCRIFRRHLSLGDFTGGGGRKITREGKGWVK